MDEHKSAQFFDIAAQVELGTPSIRDSGKYTSQRGERPQLVCWLGDF